MKSSKHDATVEEVFHLLTCNGWANVWPDVFDCSKKSQIGKTMTATIGDCGYAFNRTHKTKCTGKFHYDDRTCDWSCLAVEYTYWSETTILGYQNGPPLGPKNRCREIADEWEMCTGDALKQYDGDMYDILTNPTYKMATVLPDGAYKGTMPQGIPKAPKGFTNQNNCNGGDFASVASARSRTAARRQRRQQRAEAGACDCTPCDCGAPCTMDGIMNHGKLMCVNDECDCMV